LGPIPNPQSPIPNVLKKLNGLKLLLYFLNQFFKII
jgi:hypothetical protein